MMFSRQVTLPIKLVFGSVTANIDLPGCSKEYAFQLQIIEKINQFVRENLQFSSDNIKHTTTWTWWPSVAIHSQKAQESLPKTSVRMGRVPYSIIQKLNEVIFKIQKNKFSKPMIVHHNHLKPYTCTNNN